MALSRMPNLETLIEKSLHSIGFPGLKTQNTQTWQLFSILQAHSVRLNQTKKNL